MKLVIRNCRGLGEPSRWKKREEYLNAHYFKPDVEPLTSSS